MPCQKTSFVMLAVWCTLFHILPKNQNLFKFHLKYGFYHTMLVTFSANSIVFFLLSLGLDMKQKSQPFHLLIKVTMIQVDKRYNYNFKGRYFFINSPKAFGEFIGSLCQFWTENFPFLDIGVFSPLNFCSFFFLSIFSLFVH